jgi:hypothetical protein
MSIYVISSWEFVVLCRCHKSTVDRCIFGLGHLWTVNILTNAVITAFDSIVGQCEASENAFLHEFLLKSNKNCGSFFLFSDGIFSPHSILLFLLFVKMREQKKENPIKFCVELQYLPKLWKCAREPYGKRCFWLFSAFPKIQFSSEGDEFIFGRSHSV